MLHYLFIGTDFTFLQFFSFKIQTNGMTLKCTHFPCKNLVNVLKLHAETKVFGNSIPTKKQLKPHSFRNLPTNSQMPSASPQVLNQSSFLQGFPILSLVLVGTVQYLMFTHAS